MNIVDSSGWLAYFADAPGAKHFESPLKDIDNLLVPAITIYEVFKVVLRESNEHTALQAIAAMFKGKTVDLTPQLAVDAAKMSLQYHIPMADSIILATAAAYDAVIWTQDADFKDLPGIRFYPNKL